LAGLSPLAGNSAFAISPTELCLATFRCDFGIRPAHPNLATLGARMAVPQSIPDMVVQESGVIIEPDRKPRCKGTCDGLVLPRKLPEPGNTAVG